MVTLCIRSVETYRDRIHNSFKQLCGLLAVDKVAQTVGVQADFQAVFFLEIPCACNKIVERLSGFSVAAENDLGKRRKVEFVDLILDLVKGGIFFQLQRFGRAETVPVASDAENAGAGALVCDVHIYAVAVGVNNISHN